MPKLDAFLANLPAQINDAIFVQRGEIYQSHRQILHFDAHIIDLMQEIIKPVEIGEGPGSNGIKLSDVGHQALTPALSPPWERAGVRGHRNTAEFFPLTLALSHQGRGKVWS